MKKILFLSMLIFLSVGIFAQTINKNITIKKTTPTLTFTGTGGGIYGPMLM